jgi:hypothetical protein
VHGLLAVLHLLPVVEMLRTGGFFAIEVDIV